MDIDNGENPINESIDLLSENSDSPQYESTIFDKYKCTVEVLAQFMRVMGKSKEMDTVESKLERLLECTNAISRLEYEEYVCCNSSFGPS